MGTYWEFGILEAWGWDNHVTLIFRLSYLNAKKSIPLQGPATSHFTGEQWNTINIWAWSGRLGQCGDPCPLEPHTWSSPPLAHKCLWCCSHGCSMLLHRIRGSFSWWFWRGEGYLAQPLPVKVAGLWGHVKHVQVENAQFLQQVVDAGHSGWREPGCNLLQLQQWPLIASQYQLPQGSCPFPRGANNMIIYWIFCRPIICRYHL